MTTHPFVRYETKENEQICIKAKDAPYKSDAEISEEAIIEGLMEISGISLPDEPHKYYRSRQI